MESEYMQRALKERLPFFDKLSKEQQELLLGSARIVKYKKGEMVYDTTRECVGMLLIQKGEFRTYILSPDGREITLYWLGVGDICVLSASCVLKNITFDVIIEAKEDTEAILINPASFSRLCSENLYAENFYLRLTADRFSEVMWSIQQLLFFSIDKRLASFLLEETKKQNKSKLMLTKDEIARYMGSAREVVSRMLNEFAKQNAVLLFRGGVQVTDKEYLEKLIL